MERGGRNKDTAITRDNNEHYIDPTCRPWVERTSEPGLKDKKLKNPYEEDAVNLLSQHK